MNYTVATRNLRPTRCVCCGAYLPAGYGQETFTDDAHSRVFTCEFCATEIRIRFEEHAPLWDMAHNMRPLWLPKSERPIPE